MKDRFSEDLTRSLLTLLRTKDIPQSIDEPVITHAVKHGVTGLLQKQLRTKHIDKSAIDSLRKNVMRQEAIGMVRTEALQQLSSESNKQGIAFMLLKGMALGYQVYDSPGLRPCTDVDLMIREQDIDVVKRLLTNIGYGISEQDGTSLICYQFTAYKDSDTGQPIVLDVHYQINNRAEYARLFTFEELYERSVDIPQIFPGTRALSLADALMLACIHIEGHDAQHDPLKLIWLYDLKALFDKMQPTDQKTVLHLINEKSLGPVCLKWISEARTMIGFALPSMIESWLINASAKDRRIAEKASNPFKVLWKQFRYQPNMKMRLRLLQQLAFPPKQRIRDKYPDSNLWLPLLYLRRAFGGLAGRMKKMRCTARSLGR